MFRGASRLNRPVSHRQRRPELPPCGRTPPPRQVNLQFTVASDRPALKHFILWSLAKWKFSPDCIHCPQRGNTLSSLGGRVYWRGDWRENFVTSSWQQQRQRRRHHHLSAAVGDWGITAGLTFAFANQWLSTGGVSAPTCCSWACSHETNVSTEIKMLETLSRVSEINCILKWVNWIVFSPRQKFSTLWIWCLFFHYHDFWHYSFYENSRNDVENKSKCKKMFYI